MLSSPQLFFVSHGNQAERVDKTLDIWHILASRSRSSTRTGERHVLHSRLMLTTDSLQENVSFPAHICRVQFQRELTLEALR